MARLPCVCAILIMLLARSSSPAAQSAHPTATTIITAADCTVDRLGTSVPTSSIGEPVRSAHAGGTCQNASAARDAAVASSLRRAISSTTEVMYTVSVRLLIFPSRFERAPMKAVCNSATPN
jgi:hypothetical protein